jgi:hypothetical protein
MSNEDINTGTETYEIPSWPVLAKVVSHADPATMGALEVSIERPGAGNTDSAVQVMQVQMISPFFGSTSQEFRQSDPDNYNNTQKSYGMWFVPPDVGTTVLVIFVNGDPARGYWYGCVPDEHMNFSVPGLAATTINTPDPDGAPFTDNPDRLPVAEFNSVIHIPKDSPNPTLITKPVHPFAKVLDTQGLLIDDTRGITSSSARREAPSAVFGISTPGPQDKKGPLGLIGKAESKKNTFISRLGGTTFVMDDGDDAFQRKTTASDGPPVYASIAEKESGLPDVPHNELVRIRTRTGHQILLHNSEDLIYIGNARGTSWIELSSDGKIDIYAEDSISVHTKQDMNFYADRDINMEAGRNLNIKVAEEMHTHVGFDQLLVVEGNQKIDIRQDTSINHIGSYNQQIGGNVDITSIGNYKITVAGNFDLSTTGNNSVNGLNNSLTSSANSFITAGASVQLLAAAMLNATCGAEMNLLGGAKIKATAGRIDLNGPPATPALPGKPAIPATLPTASDLPEILKTFAVPDETGEKFAQTIMTRVPSHEPWPHHENLDPTNFKPGFTDRDSNGRYGSEVKGLGNMPDGWKKYSTNSDTFKPPPPEDQGQ